VQSQLVALRLRQDESCSAIHHQLTALQDRLHITGIAVSTTLKNSIESIVRKHVAQELARKQVDTIVASTPVTSIVPVVPVSIMPSTIAHSPIVIAPQAVIADSRCAPAGPVVDWLQLCPQVPWSTAEELLRELDLQQYAPICRIQASRFNSMIRS
jgi:hypothetical protein